MEKKESKTDWKRIDAMADKDIDYFDIPEFWDNAKIVTPNKLTRESGKIRVYSIKKLFEHLNKHGKDEQTL